MNEDKEEIERLKKLIERDRTGLAEALVKVLRRLGGSYWLTEQGNWGSYEYHERTLVALRKEIGSAFDDVREICEQALWESGDRVTEAFHGGSSDE